LLAAFSLGPKRKEKAIKKKRRYLGYSPKPRHLLKKVDENFNKSFFFKRFLGVRTLLQKGLRYPLAIS